MFSSITANVAFAGHSPGGIPAIHSSEGQILMVQPKTRPKYSGLRSAFPSSGWESERRHERLRYDTDIEINPGG
jgi:hypothetical protein